MKRCRLLLTVVLMLAITVQPVHAWIWFTGGPVLDIPGKIMNTITSAQKHIKTIEFIQHTVSMLQQVAQLYATYNNAKAMFDTLGNTRQAFAMFQRRMGVSMASWSKPISFRNLGGTLASWGIHPANNGPLADIDDMFKAVNYQASSVTQTLNLAPSLLSRDAFIRGVVKGGEVDRRGVYTMSGRGEAVILGNAADRANGQLQQQLAITSQQHENVRADIARVSEEIAANTSKDNNAIVNWQMQTELQTKKTELMLDEADINAGVTAASMAEQRAFISFLDAKREQQNLTATVGQAVRNR